MTRAEKTSLPGLIGQRLSDSRSELHGFEVDMLGRVIVPEFHPCRPDEVRALMNFESELRAAIETAA